MATDALDVDDLIFDLKSSEDLSEEEKNFDPFKSNNKEDLINDFNGSKQDASKDNFPDLFSSIQEKQDGKIIAKTFTDPFGSSQGDSLSTNTDFSNDPFSGLGGTKLPTQNHVPDPFSAFLTTNPNEIESNSKQDSKDPFSSLMEQSSDPIPSTQQASADLFTSSKPVENDAADPFMAANLPSNPDPFGTATPDPFGAANSPIIPDPFGTSNLPSNPVPSEPANLPSNPDPFGSESDPVINPDPFGAAPPSNHDLFGTAPPPSSHDSFEAANPPSSADPFGTANPPSNPDPFGSAKPPSNPDQFGTANPPSNPDPFGTAKPPSNPDPFGTANPPSNPDPFGTGSDLVNSLDPFGTANLPIIPDPFGTSNLPSNPDPFGTGSDQTNTLDPFGTEAISVSNSDPFGTIQDPVKNADSVFENGNQDPFGDAFSITKTSEKPTDPLKDSIQALTTQQTDPFGAEFETGSSKETNIKHNANLFDFAPVTNQSTDSTKCQSQAKILNYDDIFGNDPFNGNLNNQSKDSFNDQSNQNVSILNSVETINDPKIEAAFNHSENISSNTNDLMTDKTQDGSSLIGTGFNGNSKTFDQSMTQEIKGIENPDFSDHSKNETPLETNHVQNEMLMDSTRASLESSQPEKHTNDQMIIDNTVPGSNIKPPLPDVLPSLGLPDIHTSSQIQRSVEEVTVSLSDVPINFNTDVKNGVESEINSNVGINEDSIDLSQITTSLKDQKDKDEFEFDFEAPVAPVPARPAPVAPGKPVPARPAPVSPVRPAPVAPTKPNTAPVSPTAVQSAPTPDQTAPVAPIRVKRASSRDASSTIIDNTQLTQQGEGVKSNIITSTVDDWDNIQTIQPGFKGETPPEGENTVSKSTPLYTFDEANNTLQQADYTMVQNSLRSSVDRSGITAVVHFLFGPPKLNRDLIKGREFIFCLSASCLDNEQPSHSKMLQSIYRILTGSRFDSPRIGSHWEEIGFQGSDPGTDLRGVGILGLFQLLYFLQHTKYGQIARDIYKLSLHPTQNFPFCVMGINISRICLQSLREDLLNKEINKRKDVTTVVNDFYIGTYYYLYTLWKQGKTIGDSGFVLKDVETFAKKHTKDVFRSLETYKPGGETTVIKTEGQEEFFSVCKE